MNPLPEGWSVRSIVWSIILGEREEDSFLMINLSAKVIQYNLISKTLREIYDMGSNEIADDYIHGFISPYAMYDVGYRKLEYKCLTKRHAFDYIYNHSTNLFKILSELDYTNDDSSFYGCAGLRDDFRSSEFTIHEMMKGNSVWSVREDDSFLVINLSGKVVEYNLISKNLRDIYNMGSNQVTDDYHDRFISPFAMYDMRAKQVDHKVYEFIPSYASV
nr:hypothetical protein [Tanacetum cinerariifolium]